MIRAEGLVKVFEQGRGRRAVDGLSFEVEPGAIYGLLGPNGAGKTTAMRLLSALLRPTAGTAIVAGYSIEDQPHEVRARIGILTEVPGLYLRLKPFEYLDFFASLQGLRDKPQRAARVEEVLRLVGLWDRRSSVMRTFSKGMQQRVAIARTLIQDPPVLLFDEPTATLDPEAARGVREYIRDLAATRGRTILLCTHNLVEAEQLCQRLSIVMGGRQLAQGTPAELKSGAPTTCRLKISGSVPAADLARRLQTVDAIEGLTVEGPDSLSFRTRRPELANPLVVRAAVACGADIQGLGESADALEEAYLSIIGAASSGSPWRSEALTES